MPPTAVTVVVPTSVALPGFVASEIDTLPLNDLLRLPRLSSASMTRSIGPAVVTARDRGRRGESACRPCRHGDPRRDRVVQTVGRYEQLPGTAVIVEFQLGEIGHSIRGRHREFPGDGCACASTQGDCDRSVEARVDRAIGVFRVDDEPEWTPGVDRERGLSRHHQSRRDTGGGHLDIFGCRRRHPGVIASNEYCPVWLQDTFGKGRNTLRRSRDEGATERSTPELPPGEIVTVPSKLVTSFPSKSSATTAISNGALAVTLTGGSVVMTSFAGHGHDVECARYCAGQAVGRDREGVASGGPT